mmetsp:Transcript_6038/g.10345  ORF Transcript_6038/g.10345 Transcript_6038/m.10345 type:complete len:254 (-) Transcript_6038:116-877(-)
MKAVRRGQCKRMAAARRCCVCHRARPTNSTPLDRNRSTGPRRRRLCALWRVRTAVCVCVTMCATARPRPTLLAFIAKVRRFLAVMRSFKRSMAKNVIHQVVVVIRNVNVYRKQQFVVQLFRVVVMLPRRATEPQMRVRQMVSQRQAKCVDQKQQVAATSLKRVRVPTTRVRPTRFVQRRWCVVPPSICAMLPSFALAAVPRARATRQRPIRKCVVRWRGRAMWLRRAMALASAVLTPNVRATLCADQWPVRAT